MQKILNKYERAGLLNRLWAIAENYDNLIADIELGEENSQEVLEMDQSTKLLSDLSEEIEEIMTLYLGGLPIKDLSRCPFTGEKLSMAIDDFGLDGPFWNYNAPKRPENNLPQSFFPLTELLSLGQAQRLPPSYVHQGLTFPLFFQDF